MQQTTAVKQHQNRLTSYQGKVVASATAGFGLENMDVMFLSFALSSIIGELHLNGSQAGLISSITNVGMLMGGVIFGMLADRFGRIKTFTYTIFIFAFATAAMFFASNLTTIYVCRFFAGIGAGGEYGIGMTILAESFKKKDMGRVSSYVGVAGQGGAILAAVLAAFILPQFGWRALFLFGLIPVLVTFFVRRHLKESKAFETSKHDGKGQFRALFATRQLTHQTLGLMFMAIVQIAGYFGLMNWLPAIMQKQLGLTIAGSSTWMISTIIGMSAGMLTFGWGLDKLGARLAYGIFLLASAVSVYILTIPTNTMMMLFAGALVGYFANGMFAGYGAVVSHLYPTEVRATANNVIINVGRAVGGFSSVAIGFILDHYDVMAVMIFLSLLYLMSFVVMMSIKNLRRKEYLSFNRD
ncbi:MFS transporter [Dellaglioa carnosa]|uniref:MFS transporter n=1 Tax=Dellaglioa carnosa TaxID=2995136 RepID=A0ABT4JLM6_9LACO|nr:MFS transporter [Dellaglioa carnosa]MCZ2491263.1 MFS transporter [Dellaglioa carnosa]MCZ2494341.1 MFS transporter [Dellaglioa carnosa]MDK1731243.1 MFS transporter [Dellaglioa carnosa]